MSGPGLEPFRPALVLQHAAADGFWDSAAASPDNEVWRYARRLAAAAAQEHDRAPRFARGRAARVAGEGLAARPRSATTTARLLGAARGAGRALLLVGVGVVSGGMSAGGSGALPLELRSWGPLVAQASPAATVGARAMPAAATPVAAEAILPAAGARPASQPGASMPPVRATDWFTTELVDGVTLAATMRELPADAIVRADPPASMAAPAVIERPATPYRVQLALLRNPRNAGPVWRDFVTRLGPRTSGLERHVLPTRTARGLRHLVQAGPFADAGAARAMCRRVRAAGGDCLVVPPS